jgi:hypothetical protein
LKGLRRIQGIYNQGISLFEPAHIFSPNSAAFWSPLQNPNLLKAVDA